MILCVLLELPKRKKRRQPLTPNCTLYQITDLLCLVLDHIPLVGVDIDHVIHQQLYNDILLPLLTHLSTLVSVCVCCVCVCSLNDSGTESAICMDVHKISNLICCYITRFSYDFVHLVK